MNYTPLDVEQLRRVHKKHIFGPLMIFIIIILIAILAALFTIFIHIKL